MSFFDESSVGLRSVGATLVEASHEVLFLHVKPFLYELVQASDNDRIQTILAHHPLIGRDVHPTGDVFVYAHLLDQDDLAIVIEEVQRIAPDAIGMSILFGRERVAAQIASAVKPKMPRVPIIWGGIYPSLFPQEALRHADIACVGEGERPIRLYAEDPSNPEIPGFFGCLGGRVVTPPPEPAPPLDSLPLPLYGHDEKTLLDGQLSSRCRDDPELVGRIYTFAASRGCRFDCSYCLSGRMLRTSRRKPRSRRSIGSFLDELRSARDRFTLPPSINLWDDIFTEDLEWLSEFAARYPGEIGIPFNCQTHQTFCSEEAARLLVLAGAREVAIGLESGSRRVLREVYHRIPEVEEVSVAAWRLHDAGIPRIQVDLLTNNPFATEEDCRETLASLLRFPRPFSLELGKLTVYPGSRLASFDGKRGDLTEIDFDFFNMLYLLAQFPEIPAESLTALSKSRSLRADPAPLRALASQIAIAHEERDRLQRERDRFQAEVASLRRDGKRPLFARFRSAIKHRISAGFEVHG